MRTQALELHLRRGVFLELHLVELLHAGFGFGQEVLAYKEERDEGVAETEAAQGFMYKEERVRHVGNVKTMCYQGLQVLGDGNTSVIPSLKEESLHVLVRLQRSV